MTVADWLKAAIADAERRGLPELKPLLEGLAQTLDGTVISGVLVSQTDDAVEIKTAESIVHKLKRDDLGGLKKQTISLMPADLQKQLHAQDLVDIVEYLTTLKKPD